MTSNNVTETIFIFHLKLLQQKVSMSDIKSHRFVNVHTLKRCLFVREARLSDDTSCIMCISLGNREW